MRSSTTPMGVKQEFQYDAYGNQTLSKTLDGTNGVMGTQTTYDASYNYPIVTTDVRGNKVTREVDSKSGLLKSVTDPATQKVTYTYDSSKRVTEVKAQADSKVYRNTYTYEKDRIKTVSHNTTSDTCDVTYNFNYDGLGRKTSVSVGTQVLSTNKYSNDRNGLLTEVVYGNGGKVSYTYDDFDRLTGVAYDSETTPRYTYTYDASGEVAKVKDNHLNRSLETERDLAFRPRQSTLRDGNGNTLYRTTLYYDKMNRLEKFAELAGGTPHTTAYAYDKDNRTTAISYDGDSNKVSYTYDTLGRTKTRTATIGSNSCATMYNFVAGNATLYGTNATTPLVSTIAQPQISFDYAYDNRGNIISEKRYAPGTAEANKKATTYVYDALGQLIRMNDQSANNSWVYEYDRGGNMTKRIQYDYTTGTLGAAVATTTYTYDPQWKDQLTSSGRFPLTYDAIGNLKTYGGWVYEWSAGRQLVKQTQDYKVVAYEYDHNGMRIRKTYSNKDTGNVYAIYNYTYSGNRLTHMTVYNDDLHFFYDAQGRPAQVKYNGAMYTYLHNLQGDIVGILDSSGNLVVEYKYNAWGTLLSRTGSMAQLLGYRNPFRYRGYIYDDETWMYWVKSRYYYPELHRFINADKYICSGMGSVEINVFAYCANRVVNNADPMGTRYIDALTVQSETRWQRKQTMLMKKAQANPIDLTERLGKAMEDNYEYLKNYYDKSQKKYGAVIAYFKTNLEFATKVKTGGEWDYKTSWKLNRYQKYLFNDVEISYEDTGNINFGYAGSAIHNLKDLQLFAGEYQIVSGTSDWSFVSTCFDDPRDYGAITYGYLLKNGTYSTLFTSYSLND